MSLDTDGTLEEKRRQMILPLLACIMTFLGNWYGHLCMIGAYPIARASGVRTELASFYKIPGFIDFVIFMAAGVYLTFKILRGNVYLPCTWYLDLRG